MRSEDFNCIKYFYGQASLEWEKDNYEHQKISLRHKKDNKLLCDIYMSENVYQHSDEKFKSPLKFDCGIIFMATARGVKNRENFAVTLQHSDYLMIRKL